MIRANELKNFKKTIGEGYVYICLANDNTVKIGVTKYPYSRLRQIETSSGKEILNWYVKEPCKNYKEIEKQIHKEFKKCRLKGEWFNCNFLSAVQKAKDAKGVKLTQVKTNDITNEIKALNLFKLALDVKYEEFEDMFFEYDLDTWSPMESETETIKNEIEENIKYNIDNKTEDLNEYLIKYKNTIDKDIKSKESKSAMQDYYIDFIDCIGYADLAKEILKTEGKYDFVKKVLGITEIKRNLLSEKILKNIIN